MTTNIYRKDTLIRMEKRCTLKEFIQMGRLVPGILILIGEENDNTIQKTERIIIGHATPYIEPSSTDGGIGWNYTEPRMNKVVVEVHELT